jgi:hypothetical protein
MNIQLFQIKSKRGKWKNKFLSFGVSAPIFGVAVGGY